MADLQSELETRIGYVFKDRELLERALTHSSYGDGRKGFKSNERLEFLGDRVLGLLTAQTLFSLFDTASEGALAPRLNALVRKEACADIARAAEIGAALKMARSEDKAGGRNKTSILGDATEALMAAIYLDGGLDAARAFYDRFWGEKIEAMRRQPKDPKSALQEWAAKAGLGVPRYTMRERSGPDHRPVFTVEVELADMDPAWGEGGSKQAAERAAAASLMEREGRHVD